MPNFSTILICAVLAVICVLAVRSSIHRLSHGCCGAGIEKIKRVPPLDPVLEHYPCVYKVSIAGMTCPNCAARIENAFHRREGFYAQVQFKQKNALIHTKHPVPEGDLRQVIAQAGYTMTERMEKHPGG